MGQVGRSVSQDEVPALSGIFTCASSSGANWVPQNSYFLQGVLGVHDGSVVWSGVRMREYPPRCVSSKCVRLDEFC